LQWRGPAVQDLLDVVLVDAADRVSDLLAGLRGRGVAARSLMPPI
jgi:hypothetical protein